MTAIVLVHGNTVIPEITAGIMLPVDGILGTDNTGLARGWGKTFRLAAGREAWFHFVIPSTHNTDPASTGGYLPDKYLDSVSAYWTSDIPPVGGPVGVDRLHVWDGERRLLAQDRVGLAMAGDYSFDSGRLTPTRTSLAVSNTVWPTLDPSSYKRFILQEGLGLSLHVVAQGEGNITFHSARCELTRG
jgi:hypothetical protein